ncbi:hypothetical protein Q4T40_15370 [Selenomonadales bacterium 4137-cl]|uniref:Uncharacterized protein n=1 Tax=Anaeroselena agilis TaxID=3063788 RepID=A0ABU3P275_9FIRM|nr:hypothetical protein [Selenomonadales bacterium 4137-cl]
MPGDREYDVFRILHKPQGSQFFGLALVYGGLEAEVENLHRSPRGRFLGICLSFFAQKKFVHLLLFCDPRESGNIP